MPIRSNRNLKSYYDRFSASGAGGPEPFVIHGSGSGNADAWGARGIIGLGGAPGLSNIIEYITIANAGNATDFGDLTSSRRWGAATSSGSAGRGILAGGQGDHGQIDYVTIASAGNASDFGTLVEPSREFAGVSNGTRGVFAGAYAEDASSFNVIQYITIASTGNSTDFGDLAAVWWTANSAHNGERAVYWGGYQNTTQIDTFAIATTANATDWGDMLYSAYAPAGGSGDANGRGIWWGGVSPNFGGTEMNNISSFDFDSTGSCTDFGDMIAAKFFATANNNDTRAVQCGGRTPSDSNVMEYVTIQTSGNSTDFGDLGTACSGCFAGNSAGDP